MRPDDYLIQYSSVAALTLSDMASDIRKPLAHAVTLPVFTDMCRWREEWIVSVSCYRIVVEVTLPLSSRV